MVGWYCITTNDPNHGGINEMERPRGGDEYDLLLWWASVVYITSRKRTVQLGSLLGLYESFPIKK